MAIKTFTLLVTVKDSAEAIFPLPARMLAQDVRDMLSEKFTIDESMVTAYEGDATHMLCVKQEDQGRLRVERREHAQMHKP